VRLEVDRDTPIEVRDLLLAELELGTDDVYESSAPLGLGQLWALHAIDRSDLHEPPWVPMTQPRLATAGDGPVDLFSVLRERSVLVHHPYDSFTTSVEAFITQAADDPNVLAIKQTLYRTSDDTAIVSALVRAAEQGKQVAALVEVKARSTSRRTSSGHVSSNGLACTSSTASWVEDPLEDRSRRATRGGRAPPLLPYRDGQLQLRDGKGL